MDTYVGYKSKTRNRRKFLLEAWRHLWKKYQKKKIQISLQSLECMRQFICFCGLDVKVDLRDNVWIELLNIHVLKQQTALPSSFTIHSENRNLAWKELCWRDFKLIELQMIKKRLLKESWIDYISSLSWRPGGGSRNRYSWCSSQACWGCSRWYGHWRQSWGRSY